MPNTNRSEKVLNQSIELKSIIKEILCNCPNIKYKDIIDSI